jgi:hypothetical protein
MVLRLGFGTFWDQVGDGCLGGESHILNMINDERDNFRR